MDDLTVDNVGMHLTHTNLIVECMLECTISTNQKHIVLYVYHRLLTSKYITKIKLEAIDIIVSLLLLLVCYYVSI